MNVKAFPDYLIYFGNEMQQKKTETGQRNLGIGNLPVLFGANSELFKRPHWQCYSIQERLA